MDIIIRDASETDAPRIAEIYAHHVLHGTASYEVEPPSDADTLAKIRRVTGAGWPFLVAEAEETVVGYAYSTQFRDRDAYRFSAEDSIYVDASKMGFGVGKALLRALMERSSECGFRTMVAVIGGAEPASLALHSAFGFVEVGRLKSVGFKFGRWLDSVYMQRDLDGVRTPQQPA